MADDMYESNCCWGESDEMSMFLHQILLRSSASQGIFPHNHNEMPKNPVQSSIGTFDNDTDEYDCESQEGFEEEVPKVKATSKRGRAAEVHNMSEKRRRSRINEKMKALQNLIPNSNKTDKASMLDEAIEYLKQLQLQVQMLTMRNGLSLDPMGLPGVLQGNQFSEMRMGLYQGNGLSNISMTGQLPETLTSSVFSNHNKCTSPKQQLRSNFPDLRNAKTSSGLQSLAQTQRPPMIEGEFDALLHTKEFGLQSNCFSSVREHAHKRSIHW